MSTKQKPTRKEKIKASQPNSLGRKSSHNSASSIRLNFILGFIIAAIGFLLYANTLNHGYTLDDYSVIKDNNVVTQGTQGIPIILKTSYRYGYLSINDGLYRPLSLVMFALEWELSPDNPSLNHWINVLLYSLTGLLLFLLLIRLMKSYSPAIPFMASLLFIAHPIHTEIVASIKSRDEIVCFLLMISSFHLLLNYIEKKSLIQLIFSGIVFFLAMLSKETGITMLIVFPLTMYFFTQLPAKRIVSLSLFFGLAAGVYLIIRSQVLVSSMSLDNISYIDNSLLASKDKMIQLATAFKVMGMYLQLLFFPNTLVCDRSFNQIPNVGWSDLGSLLSIALYLGMGIYSLIRFPKKDLVSFGILFYLITIALFSNIVFKIGSVMAERFIYFASFGFCFVMAVLLSRLFKTERNSFTGGHTGFIKSNGRLMAILGIILLAYAFKTIDRNKAWKNNYTLYSNDVNLSPNSTRIHYYLGRELVKDVAAQEADEKKRNEIYNQGIKELEASIKITPGYADAYSQMGIAYTRKGNSQKAIECYLNALKHSPNDPITLNNLGAEYFKQQKYNECIDIYKKVLTIDPRYVDAMVNLASCYGTIQDFDNAILWFKRAIEIYPNNANAHKFLSMTYKLKGDLTNAELHYQEAVRLDPRLKQQ